MEIRVFQTSSRQRPQEKGLVGLSSNMGIHHADANPFPRRRVGTSEEKPTRLFRMHGTGSGTIGARSFILGARDGVFWADSQTFSTRAEIFGTSFQALGARFLASGTSTAHHKIVRLISSHERLTDIGPTKRFSQCPIKERNESENALFEFFRRFEVTVL
uniref:Uncharacterized protein n=1 Tax=Candidatus Kentrum sp. LPFa TaxID=2126335 RepID=A0A450X740_9GAMM|nr:MAG: hypothetical protein BECKLPF1236B_GA0070989_14573 [Candidatus Kentron sp. LPFa]